MRVFMTTVVAGALLAPPLAAQQSQPSGSTEAAPQQVSPQDMQFAEKAAQGGMLEVRLGELATQQQGKNEEVVDFGQMMVEDHSEANQKLEDIAQQKGIQLPQDLSEEGQQHYEELQQLSGAGFDRQYIDLMIEDHKKDIEAFQTQADAGLDPELVAFAKETLPVLERHLERAQDVHSQVSAVAGGRQQAPTGDQLAAMNPEDLVGSEVRNREREEIGEVEDVVVDQNQVPYAVVSVGGFLGLGEKDVVVPMERLRSGQEGEGLSTDMTQDELNGLPAYEEGQYSSIARQQ